MRSSHSFNNKPNRFDLPWRVTITGAVLLPWRFPRAKVYLELQKGQILKRWKPSCMVLRLPAPKERSGMEGSALFNAASTVGFGIQLQEGGPRNGFAKVLQVYDA